ncbi:MAG: OsmC family protein [Telmatospirillum sp.]|nr:OsmC family protein [Telmatospirillum sp.]
MTIHWHREWRQTMYSAMIKNSGNFQYHAEVKSYKFLMGQDGGNPIDVLVASLCACIGHHARDFLVEQKIVFSTLIVRADASLAADKLSLSHISVKFELVDGQATDAQKKDLLRQAELCPIYNTINKSTEIELSIH